jgi:3',5'-cyclic AMP phosphodiesterase CpdA
MHHHLIPVPDTGLEAAIVEDAGDVLKTLSRLSPDLVLSGHRHRPWSWQLNDINFLFSGAVSTIRLRGFFENSYNVIEIENGRIKPRLKIVGGDFIDFKKLM